MKLFYIALIVLLLQNARAQGSGTAASDAAPPPAELPPPTTTQYPAIRPKPPEDPNKESSSFIGDPENLDPLRARQENLKDDAEPVLEDIRQVLDAPAPKKMDEAAPKKEEPENFQVSGPKPLPKKKKVAKRSLPKKVKIAKKSKAKPTVRHNDDPDEAIEKKFHNSYMRYNAEPTSTEAWSTATFGRGEEVYIVQKGDTLWSISETLFGDSLFWPKIWALNRQGILNPHFITPGMKVRFFPGSQEYTPTLSVGEEVKPGGGVEANAEAKAEGLEESGIFNSSTLEANENSATNSLNPLSRSEFMSSEDRKLPSEGVLVAAAGDPTPLPPSMPVYRSSRYFDPPRKIEVIDLEAPKKMYIQPTVDVFLTDRLVLSDLKIARLGNNILGCNVGEVLKDFEFVRKTAASEYTILEALDKLPLENETFLYPYRKVGTLSQYADGKLRIKDCIAELSRNHLFVPTSVLDSLKTRKSSDKEPRIIGGSGIRDQQLFHQHSVVFLDMGSLTFDIGQNFGIISERIDAPAGQFKIMDRFGSFAVGIVTVEMHPIVSGDRVAVQ